MANEDRKKINIFVASAEKQHAFPRMKIANVKAEASNIALLTNMTIDFQFRMRRKCAPMGLSHNIRHNHE